MKKISIDIETFSSEDIGRAGVYRYAESPDFEILLFGYSVDEGPVQVVDMAMGERIPDEVLRAIASDDVIKWAFNATFERVCLSTYIKKLRPDLFRRRYFDAKSWRCSMIWCAYLGLPLSLKAAGAVLGLDKQKMEEGKDLIRFFCTPCRATKANEGRTRNYAFHAPGKWKTFKQYNKRDVEVEMAIQKKLSRYPVPDSVWEEYQIDQEINDRGIAVDLDLARNAMDMDAESRTELTDALRVLTSLENPNSVAQLKGWLQLKGIEVDTLGKKMVAELLKTATGSIRDVLVLRTKLSKSSVKKYQAMVDTACSDGRARGMFQFYGANRSGRWAGRHIQLQNLPQNHMPDLEAARSLVKAGDYEAIKLLYDSPPDVLSELIRTAFVPREGYKFIVSDFSAIEARVLSFLADEKWRTEVFVNNGDIYCAAASKMFGVPVEKHGRNAYLRQKGKIAELALGYGGSCGALRSMGALDMGVKEEELQPLVDSWRQANPRIVEFWWKVDRAVKEAIKKRIPARVNGISFVCRSGMLFITLPSGRTLSYVKPGLGINQFGGESVTYYGIGATKKWEKIESYGPKFVENITQAISRDILCYAMRSLRRRFICGHVHDELIIECPPETKVEDICSIMGRTPPWIQGLVLRADGYETPFYKKD